MPSARLGDKDYRNVTDEPQDDHFRLWSASELRGIMAHVGHEEDQMEMDSTEMWFIMTRKQQLQIRRTLLLELQEFLKQNNLREGNWSVMRQNCMRKGHVFEFL